MTGTLKITSPANGSIVHGTITVNVAESGVSVYQMNFYVDGKLVGSSLSPFSYQLDTTKFPDGAHTIKAASANGAVSTSVNVTVANGVTPTPTPTPTPGPVIFEDDFNGAAGSVPDPAKWHRVASTLDGVQMDPVNCFLDGKGNLVLRTKRSGSGFTGAMLATFNYGSGWPPTNVLASFTPPFRVDALILFPSVHGAHPGIWAQSVGRSHSQNIIEIDMHEERMSDPTTAGAHIHEWEGTSNAHNIIDTYMTVPDMGKNWHVYSCEVRSDRVQSYVDGVAFPKSFYGVSGAFGLELDNEINPAGSWGAGGGQPASGDPGPWDMLVDYVRVT